MDIQKRLLSLLLLGTIHCNAAVKSETEALLAAVCEKNVAFVQSILPTITPELLNTQDPETGMTALHIAVENNDIEMVKALLTQAEKIQFLLKNSEEKTVFDLAFDHGFVTIAKLLLQYDVTQTLLDLSTFTKEQEAKLAAIAAEKNATQSTENVAASSSCIIS